MKSLSEFDSIEDANTYEVNTYKDMSTSTLNAYIGGYGLADFVNSLGGSKGLMLNETRAINGVFSFDDTTTIGVSNLNYFTTLENENPDYADLISAFKDDVLEYCKTTTKPYEDLTEESASWIVAKGLQYNEIGIDASTSQQTLTLSITEDAPEACKVKIYQKLTKNTSTSEWIECAGFNGVKYSQLEYLCSVPATTAESRVLKATCDFNIGMVIV